MKWIVFPLRAVYIAGLFLICFPPVLFAAPADRAQAYFEEGIDLNKQRRYDEALENFTQAIHLNLDNHKYHQALYMTHMALRRGPQGIQFYKDLAAKHPANGTVRYWLGRFYLESRSLEDASKEFLEATRLAPQDEHAFVSLGHVYLRQGKEKEALEAYLQANKRSPRIAVVHAGMGNIYYHRKNLNKAQKEYEEALAIDASLTEARYNLGLIYEKKGEIAKAVKQWQTLIDEDPNESKAREKLARVYFLSERYLDAVREYATLSQVRQSSPEVFFALGESQILLAASLSDPKERQELMAMAAQAFQRTVELDPKNVQARKYLDRLNSEKPAPAQKKEGAPSEKPAKKESTK
ncbi:MAG: tetratricopeptide repeat protein [Candidatus Manganitrophaceae bacterium]|nr:MAG: tetratricopeptide repeat protein [Candidatus Manganitrophaceae bacterium]